MSSFIRSFSSHSEASQTPRGGFESGICSVRPGHRRTRIAKRGREPSRSSRTALHPPWAPASQRSQSVYFLRPLSSPPLASSYGSWRVVRGRSLLVSRMAGFQVRSGGVVSALVALPSPSPRCYTDHGPGPRTAGGCRPAPGLQGDLSRVPCPREVSSEGCRDVLEPRIEGRATGGSHGVRPGLLPPPRPRCTPGSQVVRGCLTEANSKRREGWFKSSWKRPTVALADSYW